MKEHKMSGVSTLSACARVVAGGVCLSITPTNPESLQAILSIVGWLSGRIGE